MYIKTNSAGRIILHGEPQAARRLRFKYHWSTSFCHHDSLAQTFLQNSGHVDRHVLLDCVIWPKYLSQVNHRRDWFSDGHYNSFSKVQRCGAHRNDYWNTTVNRQYSEVNIWNDKSESNFISARQNHVERNGIPCVNTLQSFRSFCSNKKSIVPEKLLFHSHERS
jgi:hypothetical protein